MVNLLTNNIIHLKSIDSTNNYAIRLLKEEKVPEGTTILAEEQTSGKGRGSNYWESKAGMNLTFSLILHPVFLAVEDQFMLSKIISLSLTELLDDYIHDCKIKWPNDIYYQDNKIAGILIENVIFSDKIAQSVSGVGININQEVFVSDAPNPISLKQITGKHYDVMQVFGVFFNKIDNFYRKLKEESILEINKEYVKKLYKYGQESKFMHGDEIIEGRIVDVDRYGKLILELQDKERVSFDFKEIEYLRNKDS